MIKLENVSKIYTQDGNASVGIRKINLEFDVGEFVAITGESGSGKTTLLNVVSGIDTYEEGEMYIKGEETSYFSIEDLEDYRNKYVGFIFQNYNIIDSYTVKQNVEAALLLNNYPANEISKKASELIEKVGLTHRSKTKASKLSGGEKQRVVIARALAKNPLIIAADEPTGNLDSKTSKQILQLLHEISKDRLVLIVTHDFDEVEEYATRKIRIFDGEVKEDVLLKPKEKEEIKEDLVAKSTQTKFYKMIPFAANDLVASPKRSIFNIIVYYIMCILILFAFTASYYFISTTNRYIRYNNDMTRINLRRDDFKPFSDEDLQKIRNVSGVEGIAKYNYIAEENMGFTISSDDLVDYLYLDANIKPLSSFKGKLDAGSLPAEDNEVIISVHFDNYPKDKPITDYLNSPIYAYSFYRGDITKLKIAGIYNCDNYGIEHPSYVYIDDDLFEDVAISRYRYSRYVRTLCLTANGEKNEATMYEGHVFASDELEGNNINVAYPRSYNFEKDIEPLDYDYSIEIGDTVYGIEEEFPLSYVGTIDQEKMLEYSKTQEGYYNSYRYAYEAAYIEVSNSMYEKIFSHLDYCYEISVYADNENVAPMVLDRLRSIHYSGISMQELNKSTNITDSIQSLIYRGVLLLFMVIVFVLVFLIMLHSAKSRSSDIEILRTIGASKSSIRTMMVSEYIMCGIIGYILSVITFLLIRAFSSKIISSFLTAYLLPHHFFLILLAVIIMTGLMSLLFTKFIFRKTVRKGLMGARRS